MIKGQVQRFASLDSLRGICALLVCLFHFQAVGYLTQNPLVRNSWVFVDFFFVLSGFVMAHSYGPRLRAGMTLGAFTGLRFMRLYPLHIVMLLLFLLVEVCGSLFLGNYMGRAPFSEHTSLTSLVLSVLMLHSFGLYEGLSWNHPSWSIAAEFWTYILFGLCVVYFSRALNLVSALIVATSLLILLHVNDNGINTTWQFGFIRCAYGFFIGVLGYAFWQTRGALADRLPTAARSMVELVAILATAGLIVALSGSQFSVLLPPLFLVVVLVFSGTGGVVNGWLSNPVLVQLGTWSYGIYMVHTFVQARMDDALRLASSMGALDLLSIVPGTEKVLIGRSPMEGDIATIIMLALVIVASALAHRWVELPGMRLGNAIFRRPA